MELLNNVYFLSIILRAAYIVVILFCATLTVKIIKRFLNKNDQINNGAWTSLRFYSSLLFGIIYFFAAIMCIYVIPPLRDLSISMVAGSGVLAIVIGFASQHSIANIVSGIFIAIFKPFQLGDRIKLVGKDIVGVVEEITLRHTLIRTFENKRVVIPNSVISTDIIENANIVESKICKFFEISISYDSNIDKAIGIIREAVINHADFFDNRSEEEKMNNAELVTVRVLGFGESSIILRAWVWGKDAPTVFKMVCDLNKTVKEQFDNEGIEIPFPYRTIIFKDKNNSVLEKL